MPFALPALFLTMVAPRFTDKRWAAAMLCTILTALALNLAGWSNVAIPLAAACGGFVLLALFDRSLGLGLTPVLGAGGGVLSLAVRMIDAAPFLTPAVAILGFIFFADSLFRQPALARFARLHWGRAQAYARRHI